MPIKFVCLVPHPPLLLPGAGSESDKRQVKQTISALGALAEKFKKAKPEQVIISSPHLDWGFKVPLYFLVKDFQVDIKQVLTGLEPPQECFERGKQFYETWNIKHRTNKKIALIGSGDLSHCLKEDGPYGFEPEGAQFDKALIKALRRQDIPAILNLDKEYPKAGQCGLNSFSFVLGALAGAGLGWQADILSYEAPFGVGYLVALLRIVSF